MTASDSLFYSGLGFIRTQLDRLRGWISNGNFFDKTFAIAFLLFCFSMILSLVALQVAAVTLILLTLARFLFDSSFKFRRTPLDLAVLVFIAARTISTITAEYPDLSLTFFWKDLPYYLLYFAFTQSLRADDRTLLIGGVICLIAGAIIGSTYGIYTHLSHGFARAHSTTSGYMTLSAYLSAIILLILPISAHLFRRQGWMVPILSLLVAALFFTYGRLHIVVASVGVVFLGMIRFRRLLLVFALVVIVIVSVSPYLAGRMGSMLEVASYKSDRAVLWSEAFTRSFDHPVLGNGPNSFANVFSRVDDLADKRVTSWHNDYVQLQMESGIFALTAFVWIVVAALLRLWISARRSADSWQRDFSLGIGLMLATLFISSAMNATLSDPIVGKLMWLGVAIAGIVGMGPHSIRQESKT